jgi:hypothetical protein
VYAVVDLPTHRKLAFDNNTSEDFRLFYVGHSGRKFHIREEDVFFRDHDLTEYKNSRCSATLTDEPRVAVVCSNQLVKCKPSAWISFEQAPVDDDLKLFGHNEIQFISFLHGRKIVSHWADRRMSPDLIRRTYYGWVKISNSNYEDCDHQPLPYLSGVVSLQYSGDVLDQLPELYQKFCETSRLIDYEEILHPLWTAFNGVLQDRLALASVSLERLASVWDRARENILEGPPRSNNSVWKQKPFLRRLRKTLIAALNKVWEKQPANERCTSKIVSCLKIKLKEFILGKDCESLSEEERQELKAVISTRLNNITQIPNSANLRRPFEDLALKLATKEQEALMKRNDALHGNQEEGELSILDHDLSTEYFDHLRMLITKFILKVCRYEGPFIDYASRPETGNFSVVALENILPRQKE